MWSVTRVERMILKKTLPKFCIFVMSLTVTDDLYGQRRCECRTRDINRVFFPPMKPSRQALKTCDRVRTTLEGCHKGGGTCVCISWRNEDGFEPKIRMINCLQVDSTFIGTTFDSSVTYVCRRLNARYSACCKT